MKIFVSTQVTLAQARLCLCRRQLAHTCSQQIVLADMSALTPPSVPNKVGLGPAFMCTAAHLIAANLLTPPTPLRGAVAPLCLSLPRIICESRRTRTHQLSYRRAVLLLNGQGLRLQNSPNIKVKLQRETSWSQGVLLATADELTGGVCEAWKDSACRFSEPHTLQMCPVPFPSMPLSAAAPLIFQSRDFKPIAELPDPRARKHFAELDARRTFESFRENYLWESEHLGHKKMSFSCAGTQRAFG
ncbi:hypothetical protein E1301_Tti009322 [Triplophysa tibetana]|uniref:Uncharacterized protein n=1 Tax=Triplophysa tibetana TaxID=1572043 RepID=A0A5A9NUQ6_9TELE|nr:hypothetical protein E1301_Tti009322 [Triplophysa tibetana]